MDRVKKLAQCKAAMRRLEDACEALEQAIEHLDLAGLETASGEMQEAWENVDEERRALDLTIRHLEGN